MTRSTVLALALFAFAAPAFALTETDKKFLLENSEGAQYELALAQLAQQKATRPDVKAYADRLVADHATPNAALDKLLAAKGVTPTVGIQDAAHMRLTELTTQTGAAFDGKFADEAVRINAADKKRARPSSCRPSTRTSRRSSSSSPRWTASTRKARWRCRASSGRQNVSVHGGGLQARDTPTSALALNSARRSNRRRRRSRP